jgi:hypothetical protein
MTQRDKLVKEISDKLNSICDKLLAYKKVDATLSDETLLETAAYLDLAESKLETGFVNDACDEVEEIMKYN